MARISKMINDELRLTITEEWESRIVNPSPKYKKNDVLKMNYGGEVRHFRVIRNPTRPTYPVVEHYYVEMRMLEFPFIRDTFDMKDNFRPGNSFEAVYVGQHIPWIVRFLLLNCVKYIKGSTHNVYGQLLPIRPTPRSIIKGLKWKSQK